MRYRKVSPRIWNDERFRRLTDDGKLGFFLVLTNPGMTAIGAMRGTVGGLAVELGWTEARLRRALAPAVESGMVELNEQAAYIGLPNFLRYNEPEGPNSVKKAWLAALDLVPECDERRQVAVRCLRYLTAASDKFREAIGGAIFDAFAHACGDAFRDAISHDYSHPGAGAGAGLPPAPPLSTLRRRDRGRRGSSDDLVEGWQQQPAGEVKL